MLDLILGLQSQPAARTIRSRTGNGPLIGDLFGLGSQITSNTFDLQNINQLIKLVLSQAEDADIWTAVFDLIARIRPLPLPTTPPPSRPSFTSSFRQTPWSFNTGSFADTSEHRNQVDGALKEELLPGLRFDIPDFVPAVFGQIPQLDELAEEVFDKCQDGKTPLYTQDSGWTKWPPSAKEEFVLEWLQDLIKRFIIIVNDCGSHSIARRQIYQGPTVYLDGSPIKRKMDVGIVAYDRQIKSEEGGVEEKLDIPISNWAEILVTGELKSNPVQDGQTPAWLDLATYVREVFRVQDRRFVLGFTLCGSMMRLWQFDRSGSSGSSSFDINEDGFRFVYVMLGYFLMNNKQLGRDPTIRQSDEKRYLEITRSHQIERLFLTEEIKKQAMIVGRATTCWRAYCDGVDSKEVLVVKDSWQYKERPEEGELIKEATNKGVRNIARYYHHETVQVDGKTDDTIGNVRRGLIKACGRTKFREKSFIDFEAPATESLAKGVVGRTQSQSQSRSRNNSRKRSSSLAQMAPPSAKRSCSSFESRNLGSPTHNRIHRRVITRSPGKPIYKASSPLAIINGFIGAIEGKCIDTSIYIRLLTCSGHESLLNADILHRDISIGNIMLTEDEDDGFLIDLDLASRTSDDHASGAPSKTGTKIFMAIGALRGEHHNFMHDLESFFWALFWICIHHDGFDKKGNVIRKIVPEYEDWNYLSTSRLEEGKAGKMLKLEETSDQDMYEWFTVFCRKLVPCMQELRRALFPDGKRWLSQDRNLYGRVKTILRKARESTST